jgi:glycosyltransferase involved in cell wall biosynthesis
MSSTTKDAVVFVCKAPPHRAGGGLGVAYNFLHGCTTWEIFGATTEAWMLIGEELSRPPAPGTSVDDFLASLNPGSKHGAALFYHQARTLDGLASRYRKVAVVGFSPFYFWPFLRGSNVATVHVEQSKGGRHHELAEERGGFGLRSRFIQACVGLNFRCTDRIVFPSRGALNLFTEKNPHLKEVAERKVAITYNGVAACEPPALRERSGPLRIVSVAHHVREKGLDNMLEALRQATASGTDWSMVNYGQKTDLTAPLVARAEQAGISGRIEFAGLQPQPEVRANLTKADVFLHTPVVVVFDLSLLEAMMHAVPIVITPLEGNREALGEDYPLYASTPEETAERLAWIAANRDEAARIGMALRDRALEKFTNEAMAMQYAALLRELLGHR